MKIPSEIVSGDSATWLDVQTIDNLGNSITSSTWTLYYKIAGPSNLLLISTASGSGWTTSITAVQSAALPPGQYFWQAYVTSGSDRITLSNGQIKILQNLNALSGAYDGRSQIKKDLDAVQAAMRAIISGGAVAEYTIGNRHLRKMQMGDLITLESKLKYELAAEEKASKIANGLGNPDTLKIRFK